MTPLAPQRFGFQFTGDQETRALYEEVRALLSHQIPGGEMALVFKRALQLAKAELQKRKYAVTDRPGRSRGSKSSRHIPAPVKREVHERDDDRCTFIGESGKRCDSRHMMEFEHDVTRACGGESTPKNLRLLCRAHNQYMAERVFGTEFMERKRAEARGRRRRARNRRIQRDCRGRRTTASRTDFALPGDSHPDPPPFVAVTEGLVILEHVIAENVMDRVWESLRHGRAEDPHALCVPRRRV